MWDHDLRRCYGETRNILFSVHVNGAIRSLSLKQLNQIDLTSERVNAPGVTLKWGPGGFGFDYGLYKNDFQERPFKKVEGKK